MTVPLAQAAHALDASYGRVTEAVRRRDGTELLKPSRCAGWAVCDVLAHLRMDAERALVGFATPAAGPADLSYATYWSNWAAGFDPEAAAAHARHIRIVASAYTPDGLVRHWRDTAEAAVRAARVAPQHGFVRTQDHVLSAADFVVTLAVEATIHHLDLTVALTDPPAPAPEGMELVVRTLAAMTGNDAAALLGPTGWDGPTLALKATGRLDLTSSERAALGSIADRFPLFR